jgi:hypothetical protein
MNGVSSVCEMENAGPNASSRVGRMARITPGLADAMHPTRWTKIDPAWDPWI